jgi:hypothetical protein
MTTKVNLPNGEQGVIGSPAHRLLQRMASTVTGYAVRGKGATDTQLLAACRTPGTSSCTTAMTARGR